MLSRAQVQCGFLCVRLPVSRVSKDSQSVIQVRSRDTYFGLEMDPEERIEELEMEMVQGIAGYVRARIYR